MLNPKKHDGMKQYMSFVAMAMRLSKVPRIKTSFDNITLISAISPIDVKNIGIKNLSNIVNLS
ncbi:hypothetical protein BOFE_04160 [Candidatus Borrelia fainii]|uniref:Uncharacterized protein n=1 Tax=Candidatus Borrelia fainii TaxID=2518322 RepID=A0ABM8DJV8_9SPIR|nr:hypothetical protein BOFE_04160 [Candidatus Borrelia fainii]